MKKETKSIVPGGVDEYIARHAASVQKSLLQMRAVIQESAPASIETVSYFQIPGYSYPGYEYNGMFAWFSYLEPYVRLHVRPPVIDNFKSNLKGYKTTKAIVSFPAAKDLPGELIADLVKASIEEMKGEKYTRSAE